jgi:ATP/maltotriose-dependent transcriptional regulator MalT
MAGLGQAEAAAPLAMEAVAMLRPLSDPFALLMALEVVGEITTYLSDLEEVLAVGTEAVRIADGAGYEMWSAGMKNYQAFAHLQMGDVETAARLLQEGDEVLSRLGELFMRTWNLTAQAIIAMMQDRVGDAIDVHKQAAELAQEVGYIRAMAVALHGLGHAYTVSGDLDAANDALLESLEKYERMGLVAEKTALMVMLARVRAEKGQAEQAVEILASVLADPSRDQLSVFEQVPIGEAAAGVLEPLEKELDPEVYASAHARGGTISLDVMVKQLLSGP